MESVIERGLARCPRCVAVADYCFVELGPNLLRYEVNCARCGEDYREDHGPLPFGALATVDVWLPDVPRIPLSERIAARAGIVRARAIALSVTTSAAVAGLLAHAQRRASQ